MTGASLPPPRSCGLTSQHHSAEHAAVPVQRAAVPAVVSELVLALLDPFFGALANGLHQVRVPLAELPLLVHQAGDVVADHPRSQRPYVPVATEATSPVFIGEILASNVHLESKTDLEEAPVSLDRSVAAHGSSYRVEESVSETYLLILFHLVFQT